MSASTHNVFTHPTNIDVPIWRYMDFTKFVSMLENNALYFSRADNLGDPFEGSYSLGNQKFRPHIYEKIYKEAPHLIQSAKRIYLEQIKDTYISCWHMNNQESAAMWKLYAKSNEAIAIRSTFKKLNDVLDTKCYLGTVYYVDYDNHWIPESNLLYPFVHKRLSFAHEQEVRAVFNAPYLRAGHKSLRKFNPVGGMWKHIELINLIDSIYVAPTSPIWFRELVTNVVNRYKLNKPVMQSTLDEEPFY